MSSIRKQSVIGSAAAWIWPSRLGDSPNQYVQFRHEFALQGIPVEATIRVSCDSNYALWVNGVFVDCGQFHDYPGQKTCDAISVADLRPGRNVVAFLVHYQCDGSFQYLKGSPGIVYSLEAGGVKVLSGTDTCFRVDPGYVQGPMARITPQLGFTFDYRAPEEDDWTSLDYHGDATWAAISESDQVSLDSRPVSQVRPLPKLIYRERIAPQVVAQGVFLRRQSGDATVAELMQTDFLSPKRVLGDGRVVHHEVAENADGVYIVLDLGREEAGLLDLELDAGSETVVDVAWGEHLDDLRVRSRIGVRNFACRYICREGGQRFTHRLTRLAGRYIQLHISNISRDIVVHYAGLIPVEYPIEVRGSFRCSDALHQRIYDTCVRTLHLCMHEHYEDCPWREQALYAMDMRNQALAGYFCFGEYEFPRVSLDLLARGLKPDRFLEMCAPADIAITIPVFTLAWVLAVADHYLYSGDVEAARGFLPTVSCILDGCAEAAGDGLLPCPVGPRYWHFYDWANGLDGCEWNDCTRFAVLENTRYDAPLNLFYILALSAAAWVAECMGDARASATYLGRASALRPLVHREFWDAGDRSYVTYSGAGAPLHRSELVQALAILSASCDEDTAADLRARLAAPGCGLVRTTLSYTLYKFEALLTDEALYGRHVFNSIAADWGHMLYRGATSFWETIEGSNDFDGAGSLCHGWSGIPAYFYHAYVLGVKPTAPGFTACSYVPRDDLIGPAYGVIPTPGGPKKAGTTQW